MDVGSPRAAALVVILVLFRPLIISSYAEDRASCFSSSESILISRDSLWFLLRSFRGFSLSCERASVIPRLPLMFLIKRIPLLCINSMLSLVALSAGSQRVSAYSRIGLQSLVYASSLALSGASCKVYLRLLLQIQSISPQALVKSLPVSTQHSECFIIV